mgnify:CR=1 FL=1
MAVTVEQARRLSEAAGVDVIAALSALERQNGDALEAMLELERLGLTEPPPGGGCFSTRPAAGEGPPPPGERAGEPARGMVLVLTWSDLWRGLKGLFRKSLATRLEIWRRGEPVTTVPLLVLVLLLVCFPRIIVPLLLIGLPLGFRYRFSGPLAERKAVKGFLASLREAWERFLARLRRP